MWDAKDQIWVACVKGKHLACCAITTAPQILLKQVPAPLLITNGWLNGWLRNHTCLSSGVCDGGARWHGSPTFWTVPILLAISSSCSATAHAWRVPSLSKHQPCMVWAASGSQASTYSCTTLHVCLSWVGGSLPLPDLTTGLPTPLIGGQLLIQSRTTSHKSSGSG